MKIKYYLSVFPWSTTEGQNKPYISMTPAAGPKMGGERRYSIEVDVPEPEVDREYAVNAVVYEAAKIRSGEDRE